MIEKIEEIREEKVEEKVGEKPNYFSAHRVLMLMQFSLVAIFMYEATSNIHINEERFIFSMAVSAILICLIALNWTIIQVGSSIREKMDELTKK